MLVPNRHGSSNSYRYGFQGQEKDDELKGEGNSLNYTFRMHDPRVGRFFAVDPLTKEYPHYTPYSFSGNKVIAHIELEGLEEVYYNFDKSDKKLRAAFDLFLSTDEGIEAYRNSWATEKNKTPTDVYFMTADLSKRPKKFGLSNFAHGITLNFNSNEIVDGKLKIENTMDTKYLQMKSLGLTSFDFSKSNGNNVAIIIINNSNNENRMFGKTLYSQATGIWDSSAVDLSQVIYHELYAHVILKLKGINGGNKQHEVYHGHNDQLSPSEPKPGTPADKYFKSARKVLENLKEMYNDVYKQVDTEQKDKSNESNTKG